MLQLGILLQIGLYDICISNAQLRLPALLTQEEMTRHTQRWAAAALTQPPQLWSGQAIDHSDRERPGPACCAFMLE